MNATRTLVDRPVPSAGKVWEPALQEDVRAAEALPSRRVVTLPARCSTGPRPPTRLWPDTPARVAQSGEWVTRTASEPDGALLY